MTQLYIISGGINIKIGISKHPQKRLKRLQTAHPDKLKIIFIIETDNARKIERYLHKILWQCHLKGEWFNVENVNWLCKYIESITRN
jgi:hypothetical protein